MKNKIIYIILVIAIIVGAIVISTIGLKADISYSKNVKIDIYLGKTFENEDIKQIAEDVFETDKVMVQKVEYYNDMASITIDSSALEKIDEKLENLNTKINEKYELENKKEDIEVTYQPKIKLSSIVIPYITPIAVTLGVIVVYGMIRFKKIGVLKALATYLFYVIAPEALLLSVLAICQIPVNRYVMPVALIIYVIFATIATAKMENELKNVKE